MMDWKVTGTNKHTGESATVIVQGDTAEDAAREASALGLYVSQTKPRAPLAAPGESRGIPRPVWIGGASIALAIGSFLGMMIADDANSMAGMLASLALVFVAGICGIWGVIAALRTRPLLCLVPLVGLCLAAIPVVIVVGAAMDQANRAIEQSRSQR